MYKVQLNSDPEVFKIRNMLSVSSKQSPFGQGQLSLYGRDHQFSQFLDKGSNMMFIPSTIKITKTKIYSGDLSIAYPNIYEKEQDSSIVENRIVEGYIRGTINSSAETVEFSTKRTERSDLNATNTTREEFVESSDIIKNYLSKLSYNQYVSFLHQAQTNKRVVSSLRNMGIEPNKLPNTDFNNGQFKLRFRSYTMEEIAYMSEGFTKANNFYQSRKMNYLYVQTKLNIHPAKIEVINNDRKSVTYRSPTIIIVEYDQRYLQEVEKIVTQNALLQIQQLSSGVNADRGGYRKRKYQRSTLPEEVVKAIKSLQTRIFMLCPKTQSLKDLVEAQRSQYADLIQYYNGISKRPISEQWTPQAHANYCTKLEQELASCMINNNNADFTLDEYPIAKVPHFEWIRRVYILDLFDSNYPTSQEFSLRRKAILHKSLQLPLLDRFKVIANGKLSTVVMAASDKAAVISKNFGAAQVMIFNGKRRKAIQSIMGTSVITKLVFENPMLQIPFQFMAVMDVDLYAFRMSMASSIASLIEWGQIEGNYITIDGASADVTFDVQMASTFSWVYTLFGRRALRNPEFEGLRIRFNKMIFSNKMSGKLQSKLNGIFYNITRFKKVSEKVSQYEGDAVNIEALKFAYNPGKFMNVLFLLHPCVHQLYLGEGSSQMQRIVSSIQVAINYMITRSSDTQSASVFDLFKTVLSGDLAYTGILNNMESPDDRIAQLNEILNNLSKDVAVSTLAQKIVYNSSVSNSIKSSLPMGGDIGKLILLRTRMLQYLLQRWLSEFIEFIETYTMIIHFYAEKKFKGISDTNIHSLIVYYAQLATLFMQARLNEFEMLLVNTNPVFSYKLIFIGSTGLDVQTFLYNLVGLFGSILHYVPRPRAHKAKYTKYLVFDPKINATASRVRHFVFDSQKWSALDTASIVRNLLRDNGKLSDFKINIWNDDATKLFPKDLQFTKLLLKPNPSVDPASIRQVENLVAQMAPQVDEQIMDSSLNQSLAFSEMVPGFNQIDDMEDVDAQQMMAALEQSMADLQQIPAGDAVDAIEQIQQRSAFQKATKKIQKESKVKPGEKPKEKFRDIAKRLYNDALGKK